LNKHVHNAANSGFSSLPVMLSNMNFRRISQHNLRLLPVQLGIIATFLLIPSWLKWPAAPPPFTASYVTGFVILLPITWTIVFWFVTGVPGLRHFLRSRWRILWAASLILLLLWAYASQSWAFVLEEQAGVAQNATLQMALVVGFSIVTACAAPPPRHILRILIFSMLLHGSIGGLQVAQQGDIGLTFLGEFSLDPQQSGASVIQTGDIRWLRPYGLLPHPNILAGVLVVGLVSAASLILAEDRRYIVGSSAFFVGLWYLLLTFSRSAWLGFVVGMLLAIPMLLRKRHLWRRFLVATGLVALIGLVFVFLYHPLLLSRAGIGTQGTEVRSIADRIVFTQIAQIAIAERPLRGYGAGNFPWYASHYLFFETNYDLRGDNVHNIYLGIWTELGVTGLSLFLAAFVFGIMAAMQHPNIEGFAFLVSAAALMVVGLFDHYPWSLIQTQTLWLGLIAMAVKSAASNPNTT